MYLQKHPTMRCHFPATRMAKIKNSGLCVLTYKVEGFLSRCYKVLFYELLLHKTNDKRNQYPRDEAHTHCPLSWFVQYLLVTFNGSLTYHQEVAKLQHAGVRKDKKARAARLLSICMRTLLGFTHMISFRPHICPMTSFSCTVRDLRCVEPNPSYTSACDFQSHPLAFSCFYFISTLFFIFSLSPREIPCFEYLSYINFKLISILFSYFFSWTSTFWDPSRKWKVIPPDRCRLFHHFQIPPVSCSFPINPHSD